MSTSDLPIIYTLFNCLSGVLLFLGYKSIKNDKRDKHEKQMLGAVLCSAIFLVLYLIYHYSAGHVKYPYTDFTRYIYFIILIPHIILATVMAPFILALLWYAFKKKFEVHKKIARKIWPIWMYVSVTGVIIWVMLYGQQYL